MNRLLESRQRRIEMQDVQIKEMKEKNTSLQQQLNVLELKVNRIIITNVSPTQGKNNIYCFSKNFLL